jgi:hypothetical protein
MPFYILLSWFVLNESHHVPLILENITSPHLFPYLIMHETEQKEY